MFSSLFLIATVYQQLKRMNYMDVAGKESIHVTINDAVMHALKTVRSSNCIRFFCLILLFLFQRVKRDSIVYLPDTPMPYVGIENAAYLLENDEENNEAVIRSYF